MDYTPVNIYGSGNNRVEYASFRAEIKSLAEPNSVFYGEMDGRGQNRGMRGGGRRNTNDEPCDIDDEMSGPGYGQGEGRGEGRGR